MWLASSILIILGGHWFWLSLAGLLLLSIAGLHTIWIYVSYVIRRRNLDIASTNIPWPIPDRLYIPWTYLVTWGRMVRASRWVREHVVSLSVLFGFIAGSPCGYLARDVQQYMRTRTETIHVLRDLGDHQYITECEDPQGCRLEVCLGPDPGFDSGDWVMVTWEEQGNGHGGRCMSFMDLERTGWHAIPGHAKNREALWTSPQQNPQ